MKTRQKITLLSVCIFLLFTSVSFSQAPEKFNFQAIVREAGGQIIPDELLNVEINIKKSNWDGVVVYSETHSTNTNSFGLVTLEIGSGTTSDDFTAIDWGSDTYFIEVRVWIPSQSAWYDMGITQILSVPYALHSKTAENA